jgi:hypothetical protein
MQESSQRIKSHIKESVLIQDFASAFASQAGPHNQAQYLFLSVSNRVRKREVTAERGARPPSSSW